MLHHHPARVARQASRRFRGNVRPIFENGLAGLLRIRQHWRIDVDHHLVPFSRRAGIEPVVKRCLREQGQRVRLLLGHRRGVRGWIGRASGCLLTPAPLVQRLAGRCQCFPEQGPDLWREAASDNHRAVLVLVHVKRPARVLPRGLSGLGLSVYSPPAPDDPLDVGGRARPCHRQQPLFRLRRGDPGQSPDLGVRRLPHERALGLAVEGLPGRAPPGPSLGPHQDRVPPASSATRRRSGIRYSSRCGRRTRGSGRGGAQWRPQGAPTARRSHRLYGRVPRRASGWRGCRASGCSWRASLLLGRLYTRFSEPPGSLHNGRFRDEQMIWVRLFCVGVVFLDTALS